jgi:phosphomevalonate kinase
VSDPACHSVTVPGNLLLAGEYAVLEEGGLGLACAVEPHVHVTWRAGDAMAIEARFEDRAIHWTPNGAEKAPLLDHLWDILSQCLSPQLNDLRFVLTLDSTALARPDGGKSGLGSSAAAVVGATAALMYLQAGQKPATDDIFQMALAAHRHAQGGRGSGYDVACSTYGGMGLFTGGQRPCWTPLAMGHSPAFKLIAAPKPVSTHQAVTRWAQWKGIYPNDWARALHQSQQVVSALVDSQDRQSFEAALATAAALGHQLGRDIGVWDAVNQRFIAAHQSTGLCKAVGAGNELFAQVCDVDDPTRVPLASKGLVWY